MSPDDLSLLAALTGGLISFLSPCVLPLVPGYLCFVAGTSLDKIEDGAAPSTSAMLLSALTFVLGFTTVFVALGAGASAITQWLLPRMDVIAPIAGVIIVLFGLYYMKLIPIPFLDREARANPEATSGSLTSAYVIGLAFAFGWTPCIGPILAAILTLTGTQDTVSDGVLLLFVYSMGLGIPFILAALAMGRFVSLMQKMKRHMRKIEIGAGSLLVVTGVMIAMGTLQTLGNLLLDWFPGMATLG